jgi:hypothetical protein
MCRWIIVFLKAQREPFFFTFVRVIKYIQIIEPVSNI